MKKILLILLATLGAISPVLSDTQYVSDQLRITLRTGQGSQFQIIRALESGTKLEVIEQTESGYSNVRTEDGTEGWVRSQYLIPEPIARDVLVKTEAELAKYKKQVDKLKTERNTLRIDKKQLLETSHTLSQKKISLASQLDRLNKVAAKPIMLDKQNRELQQKTIRMDKDMQMLHQENQVLKDRSNREWFIAGAGVLIGGILLGLLIPKIRFKKKSGW